MRIVTLLTDFGTKDSYVAQMKAVILAICPNCLLVDITHDVARHDVLGGAFILETAVPFFPEDTVHLAVVDPSVGTDRLPLVVSCEGATLVGPDNGLLTRAGRKLGILKAYAVQNRRFKRLLVSDTFHGRDLFAVTAARLAAGARPENVGPQVPNLVDIDVPPAGLEKGWLTCHVLHVDGFGNVITNSGNKNLQKLHASLGKRLILKTRKHTFQTRVAASYAEGRRGELVIIRGSQGYVEVALKGQAAAAFLGVKPLDELRVRVK